MTDLQCPKAKEVSPCEACVGREGNCDLAQSVSCIQIGAS